MPSGRRRMQSRWPAGREIADLGGLPSYPRVKGHYRPRVLLRGAGRKPPRGMGGIDNLLNVTSRIDGNDLPKFNNVGRRPLFFKSFQAASQRFTDHSTSQPSFQLLEPALGIDLAEGASVAFQHCALPRVLQEAANDAVRVFRINLHRPSATPAALAGDERGAGAAEQIRDDVSGLAAIQ